MLGVPNSNKSPVYCSQHSWEHAANSTKKKQTRKEELSVDVLRQKRARVKKEKKEKKELSSACINRIFTTGQLCSINIFRPNCRVSNLNRGNEMCEA